MKYRGILRTGLPTEYHMFDTKDGKKMHFKFTISDPL